MFVFDWRMGLVCLIPLILAVYLLTRMMGGKNARFFSRYQKALEDLSAEATEYVRGIPVVKVFQQTVYSFKTFYASILSYSKLAEDYSMSCRNPMTGFTTVLNSTFVLLIPVGMILCRGASDGFAVLVDLLFYILFTPMCALMMTRIMYASEATMEADEAVRKLDEIMEVQPLGEEKGNTAALKESGSRMKISHLYLSGCSLPCAEAGQFYHPKGSHGGVGGPLRRRQDDYGKHDTEVLGSAGGPGFCRRNRRQESVFQTADGTGGICFPGYQTV